jgi:hypothetical protein
MNAKYILIRMKLVSQTGAAASQTVVVVVVVVVTGRQNSMKNPSSEANHSLNGNIVVDKKGTTGYLQGM